jgi:hypothetical protein
MILSDIRNYLRERGQASLSDVALHFDSEPDAVRGMLDIWVRKGRLLKLDGGGNCGGCNQCDPAANEVYQWVGSALPASGSNCGSAVRRVDIS